MRFSEKQWRPVQRKEMKRLIRLGWFFSFLLSIVLLRAFIFQVWKREPWKTIAPRQYQQRVKLAARRGIIFDRQMNILTMDKPVFSLAMDPTQVSDVHATASTLVRVLGGERNIYKNLLERNRSKSFIWIKKNISEDQKKLLSESKIHGIIPVQERKRVRPYDKLAFQIIGITNSDHRGVGGIEQAFDKILRGEDGWAIYQKDGYNRNYSCLDYPLEEPMNGYNVVLTLDYLYQTIVEEEMEKGIELYQAQGGSAVLMDPFTGEVLSMVSVLGEYEQKEEPDFGKRIQNQAVQVDFEPGSTFKIVVAAAAIEEEMFKPGSLIHCENGEFCLSGHTIHDDNRVYSWLTFSQVMENSSNIGIAKIGMKLGKKTFYKYIQNFGFGNRTGIGLPGEVSGILWPVYQWSDFSTATIAFGQGISVTGIQMACMTSVIANGGELLKPRILRAILDDNGKKIKVCDREVIRSVISESTAKQLTEILEGVVNNGSGYKAAVKGIRIAGKTGTAQKSVPGFKGYLPGAYVSSFVGFWPVEEPLYVLVIILDEPKKMYWGSKSAAPMFARIVERISGLGVSPGVPENFKAENQRGKVVFSSLQKNVSQFRDIEVSAGRNGSLYKVPGLLGLSLREALKQLAARGIEARVEGCGLVVNQEPEQGAKVEKGMVCLLKCRDVEIME